MLLLSCSCAISIFSPYRQSGQKDYEWDPAVLWFQDDGTYGLFSAAIDMRKNHYTGIMVVDPLPSGGHRVVFMTEFGLKIFDMEFISGGAFKLHYCMAALNKKPVVETLRNDIGLVIKDEISGHPYSVLYDRQTGNNVFQVKKKQMRYYYTVDQETNKVSSVLQTGSLFRKVRGDFCCTGGSIPDSVRLDHHNKRLTIKLVKIDEAVTTSDE